MKNNELQYVWKSLDEEMNLSSRDELSMLLDSKIRKTINRFNFFIYFSALVSIGFITFLVITALNRNNDQWYQINNLFVIVLILISLISTVLTWRKLNRNINNLPLKLWLEKRIKLLTEEITSNWIWLVIPLLAIPSILSIHVYYEHKLFLEVLAQEESVYGLIFGLIIGGMVAVFFVFKIRKYQKKQLVNLQKIYKKLVD